MANIKKPNISTALNDHPVAERSRSPAAPNDRISTALNDHAAREKRRERTPYHGAALNMISYRLHKYQKNGDVTIFSAT